MSKLTVMVCRFRRMNTANWETGVIVNENRLIIDMQGEPVPLHIHNYVSYPADGTMVVETETPDGN